MEAQILVVPRSKLFKDIEPPDGFSTKYVDDFLEIIRREYEFADRKEAENRPDLKQIIPYILVAHLPPDKPDKYVFLMHRSMRQDEERLRDLYSIGVGGHLNPELDCREDLIASGLKRELNEELVISADYRLRLIGCINDDSNPVGQVHFGLAYSAVVQTPDVSVREKDLMSGSFATLKEAESVYPSMETWSQIVFRNIDSFLK